MDISVDKNALSIFKQARVSIIGSIDEEGFPNIKAMLKPRKNDGLRTFYFTTNTSSMRVKQFKNNSKASIYFFSGILFKGILLKGNMEVMEDQETKNIIWKMSDTQYYSKGVTDPDYCVLKFTAIEGRIYEKFHSTTFKIN